MRLAPLLVLCACGSSAAPPPPIKATVAAVQPTPPPSIAWSAEPAGHFDLNGLPAIARDRSVVVLPLVDNDGGRGYPNLRLEVRSGDDKLIDAHDVLLANEFETHVIDDKPAAALAADIDETNRGLARLHDQHDMVAMKRVGDAAGDTAHVFDNGAVRVRYTADSRLAIVFADGRKPIAIDGTAWRAPKGRCENPEWLKNVYTAPAIDALVVDIAYQGTDTCWEPQDQLHVVRW